MFEIGKSKLAALAAASALGCVLMLSACAPDPTSSADETDAASDSRPSTSASSVPEVEPSAGPGEDDPASWEITTEAVGPLMLGMRLDALREELPEGTSSAGCDSAVEWTSGDGTYRIVAASAEGIVDLVAVEAIDANQAVEAGPRTGTSLGVGSNVNDVLASYPDADLVSNADLGDRRSIRTLGDDGSLFFTYTQGSETVWALTATTREAPPYAICG